MIKVIMGLKGSGKTKQLINAIQDAVAAEAGDIVCIEYGKKLTYDVNYKVRLVDSEEYGIKNVDMLKGLISGLHAGNFDITFEGTLSAWRSIHIEEDNQILYTLPKQFAPS